MHDALAEAVSCCVLKHRGDPHAIDARDWSMSTQARGRQEVLGGPPRQGALRLYLQGIRSFVSPPQVPTTGNPQGQAQVGGLRRARAGPAQLRPAARRVLERDDALAAAARRRHAGRAAGPAAALCRPATARLGGEDGTRRPHLLPEQQRKTHDLDETASGSAHSNGHRGGGATPGDVPGDLPARGRARLAPARPRPEHGPGDDGDRTRGRRCRLRVLTRPIRHRRDTSHAGPGGQFVVPLPAAPPPRGPFYPYMAPGHGG